ncbi:MAG: AzlD domain-containing protein [Proteobacteria bacterium]|nr:AzlD domain-containing protein [Pseudomonadota bacterium]
MSLATVWAAMLGMGLLTLLLRSSFLLLPEHVGLPPLLRRALRYVPAAVLTAIYAPEMLVQSGAIDFSPYNTRLLAGVVAIGVAWRLRRTFFTIVAGMVALHAFGTAVTRLPF